MDVSERTPAHRLEAMGIETGASIHWNLTTAPLVEHAVSRGEGELAKDGPLVVKTSGSSRPGALCARVTCATPARSQMSISAAARNVIATPINWTV